LIAADIVLRGWSIATLGRFFQYQIKGPARTYTGIALVLAGIS